MAEVRPVDVGGPTTLVAIKKEPSPVLLACQPIPRAQWNDYFNLNNIPLLPLARWEGGARLWKQVALNFCPQLRLEVRPGGLDAQLDSIRSKNQRRAEELQSGLGNLLRVEEAIVSPPTQTPAKDFNAIVRQGPVLTLKPHPVKTWPGPALTAALIQRTLKKSPSFDSPAKVVNLATGQNGFPAPQAFKDAQSKDAQSDVVHRYGASPGNPDFLKTLVEYNRELFGIDYGWTDPNTVYPGIYVSAGGKAVLDTFFKGTIVRERDAVLVLGPHWPYENSIKQAGGRPITIPGSQQNHFKVTPAQLREQIQETRRKGLSARFLVITNPSNPTGIIYKEDELEEFAKIAVENDMIVVEDTFYAGIIYNGTNLYPSIAALKGELGKKICERTVVVGGASKALSAPGDRIAWVIGPVNLIDTRLPEGADAKKPEGTEANGPYIAHLTEVGQASNLSQSGVLAGLRYQLDEHRKKPGNTFLDRHNAEFAKRAELVTRSFNEIGFDTVKPEGSFYAFPKIPDSYLKNRTYIYFEKDESGKPQSHKGLINNDGDFALFLLRVAGVAVVPGTTLGDPGHNHLRVAFGAADEETLQNGVTRIAKALLQLDPLMAPSKNPEEADRFFEVIRQIARRPIRPLSKAAIESSTLLFLGSPDLLEI